MRAGARRAKAAIRTEIAPGIHLFRSALVDWFLHRVYDELAGPLTDAIAPIPSK